MSYPVLDKTTVPCIVLPMRSTEKVAKKYLGYKAATGEREFDVEFVSTDGQVSTTMQALYEFFKTDCKRGTSPFLISLPWMGAPMDDDLPNFLVRFANGFSADFESVWKTKHKLIVVGVIDYITADSGSYVVNDIGDLLTTDPVARTIFNTGVTL